MAELNKFNTYGYGFQAARLNTKDKVDKMLDEMIDLHMFNEVQDFVRRNFGEIDGEEWFDYPDLHKSVYVLNENEKIEVCLLKNNKQYYGKGWKPILNK